MLGGAAGPALEEPARRSLSARYCDLLFRRRHVVVAAAIGAALVAGAVASRLELRTNIAELLPSEDPAVKELHRTARRIGGTVVLELAIESPDRDANVRFADAVSARLRQLPPKLVQSVIGGVRDERAFFASHKWLYADLPTLESLRAALEARVARAKNPMIVDLDDGETPEEILRRLEKKKSALETFPTGYFEGEGGKLVVVVVRPPGGYFGEHVGEALRDATQAILRDLHPERFHPAMKVGLTGDVMTELEERDAVENDLVWATSLCVLLVCLVVALFFGRLRAVFFVAIPALLGVTVAFAFAEIAFGYLNASTAFMGSIIVGNGINFAIVQLARYEEERRAGASPREAAETSLRRTIHATAVAALGAAASYGSLMLTRFRGFSQFGMIGAVGMLAAWAATVTVLPALCVTFDRRGARTRRIPTMGGASPAAALGRFVARSPRPLLAISAVLSVAAALPLGRYLRDPFEYNLHTWRNRRSLTAGAGALTPRVDEVFGETLTPSVILDDGGTHGAAIQQAIEARDLAHPPPRLVTAVRTIDDFLPGTPPLQRRKLEVLAQLRHRLDDPALRLLDDDERKKLAELRPPDDLRPLAVADLPRNLRQPFTEADGSLGHVVLVYDDERTTQWDGHNLIRLADLIGEVPLADGTTARSSSRAVVFASMLRSIGRDAPIATGLSLLAVAALVFALDRGRGGGALVVGTLCLGVLWMLGAVAWAGVKANFLNFIALPITFGIGVDYGINIYRRYRLEGRGGVARAVGATGPAVALCSLTTIIGYGALLVADNQALRSFGEMAILGEVSCLSAAVAVMPAFLSWAERRAER